MTTYDYFTEVKKDVRNYLIKHKIDVYTKGKIEAEGIIYEAVYDKDEVTGFPSGSYTHDVKKAEECLKGNESDIICALEDLSGIDFGIDLEEYISRGPEACDTIDRLFTLPPAISELADELCEDEEYLKAIGYDIEDED